MQFEKINYAQWCKDAAKHVYNKKYTELNINEKEYLADCYDNIKLPQRSTKYSAGYDFYSPFSNFYVDQNIDVVVPTGVCWKTEEKDYDKVLLIVPRSGLGFKYGMRLLNTVGVIDADYCNSSNEGHILIKITANEKFVIEENKGFAQGIIVPYCTTDNEIKTNTIRNGGFGSTDSAIEVNK